MGRRSKWKRRTDLRAERAAATMRTQSCALLGRVGATSLSSTGTSATHATSSCKCSYRLLEFIITLIRYGILGVYVSSSAIFGHALWFWGSLGQPLELASAYSDLSIVLFAQLPFSVTPVSVLRSLCLENSNCISLLFGVFAHRAPRLRPPGKEADSVCCPGQMYLAPLFSSLHSKSSRLDHVSCVLRDLAPPSLER
jgi:hypothetical protein